WLPPLLIFSLVVVQFEPIFVKLAERYELSTYPRWALSLIQWNRVYWYLPTIVTLVFLVAAAEYSLFASGKQRLGVWIWRSEIVASALFAWYFIVRSVMW